MNYDIMLCAPSRTLAILQELGRANVPAIAPAYSTRQRVGRNRVRKVGLRFVLPGFVFVPTYRAPVALATEAHATGALRRMHNPDGWGWATCSEEDLLPISKYAHTMQDAFTRGHKYSGPIVSRHKPGDIVRFVRGPLKGMDGTVEKVINDNSKEELYVLSVSKLPVTCPGYLLKPVP